MGSERSRVDDAVAAAALVLFPLASTLPFALVAYASLSLARVEPSQALQTGLLALGSVPGFIAASVVAPRVALMRRVAASVLGLLAATVTARVLPFAMLDDKPYPFQLIDVLEELALHVGTYGAMLLTSFAVLRWSWTLRAPWR